MSQDQAKHFCVGCFMAFMFLTIEYLNSKYPNHFQTFILLFNALGYICTHLAFKITSKGSINSLIPSIYLYHFYLSTLAPSKRHLMSLIFALTVVMHTSIATYHLGEIDEELIVSGLMSVLLSDLGLRTNQARLSQMYQMILENTKLAEEKLKVVQEFPHPVLILPQQIEESSNCYSNEEFEEKIQPLNQEIQELRHIQVKIDKKDSLKNHQERCSLLQYLGEGHRLEKNQPKRLKRDAIIHSRYFCNKDFPSLQDSINGEEDEQKQLQRNFNIKSLKIEWKGVPSVMHVFIDTTDIIKLEQAKNRIKMQKIMFASASHEFRTPLNAIIHSFNFIEISFEDLLKILHQRGVEELLGNSNFCEQVEIILKFLKTGSTSSVLLLALVEDILNLSKIDNGTITTKSDFFHIPDLLRDVHSLFSIQCENKGIELTEEFDETLQLCEIKSDCKRIKQVLLNLVSNSLKFTFSGFIKIKAEFFKTLEGSDFIEFRVRDTGTGIKEQDQECLFQLFGVVENNGNLNPDGCGLGLTISKKYVEMLGGDIRVESVYGEGTEMIFTILIKDMKRLPFQRPMQQNLSSSFFDDFMKNVSGLEPKINEEYSARFKANREVPASKCNVSRFSY
ncbi:unnamed protein product [Moneuplotes crassus]|uniref:histidine kinase n=1 Tax=Euplotes crassus TaxID=5936 RepID=A0AAD2D1U1_EUPCR|nr:unnamed protein product [Moneuplotes crassus]